MNLRLTLLILAFAPVLQAQTPTVTGKSAFADFSKQSPGIRRKITVADLPEPNPAESVGNIANLIPRPQSLWPTAPAGFKVELYAGTGTIAITGPFTEPRLIRTAPNGDLFVADSHANKIQILRGVGPDGRFQQISTFATGLDLPFGIAFYPAGPNPKWVYIGTPTAVIRLPYRSGDLVASGPPETIAELPGFGLPHSGGHWTRDVVFSKSGDRMLVSVSSSSNIDDPDTHPKEERRADILEFTPQGKFLKVYATGIRNCSGEAINPITGMLWCSVNERDGLGNNLVPDYITSVQEGGFYGWPWFYMGGHQDPRHPNKHPELQSKVLTPDVLVQPHMASLQMLFYPQRPCPGTCPGAFPSAYTGDIFAAEHGSSNRANRGGYEVIRVPLHDGKAEGSYEDFLTGFVTPAGEVWGRPVGVTVGLDGSLFVTDDGSKSIWHVTYTGKK